MYFYCKVFLIPKVIPKDFVVIRSSSKFFVFCKNILLLSFAQYLLLTCLHISKKHSLGIKHLIHQEVNSFINYEDLFKNQYVLLRIHINFTTISWVCQNYHKLEFLSDITYRICRWLDVLETLTFGNNDHGSDIMDIIYYAKFTTFIYWSISNCTFLLCSLMDLLKFLFWKWIGSLKVK